MCLTHTRVKLILLFWAFTSEIQVNILGSEDRVSTEVYTYLLFMFLFVYMSNNNNKI